MSEEELLLGRVFFAPVGLSKDFGPRRLLGQNGPRTGPLVNPVLDGQTLAQKVPHNESCRVWAEELGSNWLRWFVACP